MPAEPAGGAQERDNLGRWPTTRSSTSAASRTRRRSSACRDGLESRFAREALELDNQGLTLFTLAPNFRIPFGHRHKEQEEVYVVVKGSARIKLDDEIVDLATWDAVRIPPATPPRRWRPGPDGAEVLAVGAPNVGFGDAEQLPDFWPE